MFIPADSQIPKFPSVVEPPRGMYDTVETSWRALDMLGYGPALVDVRTQTRAAATADEKYLAPMVRHNGLCLVTALDEPTFFSLVASPAWHGVPIFARASVEDGIPYGTFVFKSFGNHKRTLGRLHVHSVANLVPGFERLEKFVSFPPSEDGLCQWIQPPVVHKAWLSAVPAPLAEELLRGSSDASERTE